MKFLEIPQLGLLASMLSNPSHSVRVTTRIEAYSCKSVARERKMMKSLDQEFATDLQVSVSSSSPDGIPSTSLESAFGRLDKKDCRKTFWLLIATLNAAYPDHNFSRIKVEDFQSDSARNVLIKLSEALELDQSGSDFASTLGALSTSPECIPRDSSETTGPNSNLGHSLLAGVHPVIGQVLDPVIDLSHCEIYSYCPDPDSDPHAVVSDDDEDIESVASSIYGSSKYDIAHEFPIHPSEDTMWEIEGVEAPRYIHPNTLALPSEASYNLSNRIISTSPSPQSVGNFHPIFSQRSEALVQPPYPTNATVHQTASLRGPYGTNYEEESAGGLLWSSHYFFYNRKKKRILFISTWGRKALLTSSSMDESWISHQDRQQDEESNNFFDISPTIVSKTGLWENTSRIPKSKDNMTTRGGPGTYQSKSNQHLSGHKRNFQTNSTKGLDLGYEPQSFKRNVDASASTSSASALTRPMKKKRSKRNL